MSQTLFPNHAEELAEYVRSSPLVIAVGAGTKPRLAAVDAVKICSTRLCGIVEYDASEFTFTAQAGTPLRQIADTLRQSGQYLPFDPMLVDAGATLGGTVASGLSGPGRFRFGGLRDFILGVQFVDGAGRLLRLGGKVVKNAAGFDVPKFFVGSMGRFGIMTELTFKVFPLPASRVTLLLDPCDPQTIAKILQAAGSARWEVEALDVLPESQSIALRLGGPPSAMALLAQEILSQWSGRELMTHESDELWADLREFRWVSGHESLVKVALTPAHLVVFHQSLAAVPGTRYHLSSGGNVAFIAFPADQALSLDETLRTQKLTGLTLCGESPLWMGLQSNTQISQAVKAAFDAENRFPTLDS